MVRPSQNQNQKSLFPYDFIVSKTDKHGKIIYGNKTFRRNVKI
jgi:hypothetical protein